MVVAAMMMGECADARLACLYVRNILQQNDASTKSVQSVYARRENICTRTHSDQITLVYTYK